MRWRSATGAIERFCATIMVMVLAPPPGDSPPGREGPRSERGDVPGWVMITVMTAVVVLVLIGVFRDAVIDAVKNAFKSISDTLG